MRLHYILYTEIMLVKILFFLIIHNTKSPLISIHGISTWCIRIIEKCIFHTFSAFFRFLFSSIIMLFLHVNKIEFFLLSIQTITINLHGSGNSGIDVTFCSLTFCHTFIMSKFFVDNPQLHH